MIHVSICKDYNMDFNYTVDRTSSNCVKYNPGTLRKLFGSEDLLPFWVADTDFPSPQEVISSINERVNFGNFGYELYPTSLKRFPGLMVPETLWLADKEKRNSSIKRSYDISSSCN